MLKRWALVLVILLVPTVSALSFDSYDIEVDLEDKVAVESIEILARYTGDEELVLFLPPDIHNLELTINDKGVSCSKELIIGATEIRCPLAVDSDYFVKASFETKYPIVSLGNKLIFKQQVKSNFRADVFRFRLKLPEGYAIPSKNINKFITPEPTDVYSDGRRIILLFEKNGLTSDFEVSAIYESLGGINYWYFLLLLLLIPGYIIYRKKFRKRKLKIRFLGDEKRVIDIVREQLEPIRQRDIENLVDFSKAKLSRVLRHLEERGVIKRTPKGKTNYIELK